VCQNHKVYTLLTPLTGLNIPESLLCQRCEAVVWPLNNNKTWPSLEAVEHVDPPLSILGAAGGADLGPAIADHVKARLELGEGSHQPLEAEA